MDLNDTPANFRQLMGFDANNDFIYEDDDGDTSIPHIQKITKSNNTLPHWGNLTSMNLNPLLLENILQSTYYKDVLNELQYFQQVTEQILHKVRHLEPWERGTRKTFGAGGMCGGVRGVGAGGVISTAFCTLYKLFALKLTRKQLVSMINSTQSVYLRGVGFLYIRYTQQPSDLWAWLGPYLDDTEEIDPKAGGGDVMTVGQVVKLFLTKLDWYGTLFPRIPKDIDTKIYPPREDRRNAWKDTRREDRPNAHVDRFERPSHELPKKRRCGHHLRHHHCRKHKKRCPRKAMKTTNESTYQANTELQHDECTEQESGVAENAANE